VGHHIRRPSCLAVVAGSNRRRGNFLWIPKVALRGAALAGSVGIRDVLVDAIKTHRWKSQVELVGNGLRPGFDLLVGGQVVPGMSSTFVKQAPSAVVGLLVAIRYYREAIRGLFLSVCICMAVCMAVGSILDSLMGLDHTCGPLIQKQKSKRYRPIVAVI
jgi:hypothetical protein